MEQSVPLSGAVSSKVKIWRNVAAVLLSFDFIWEIVTSVIYVPDQHAIMQMSVFLGLVGWCILLWTASNRATKTALRIICVGVGAETLLVFGSGVVDFPQWTWRCIYVLELLIRVFGYAVIIRNNRLKTTTVTWIGMLVIHCSICPVYHFADFWTQGADWVERYSNLNLWFAYILYVLLIIAFFKFARCEAFGGNYDNSPAKAGAYNPLNKYVIGFFITSGVVIAALWAMYGYVAPLLREL